MGKKNPAVSVIIPMYNAEKFIGLCLESILAQTFKDFEVILVDHHSTDKSLAVAEDYAPKFAEIGQELRIIKLKTNFGNACVPRNKGLNLSRGKYIYFMDSDDLIIPNALAELYQLGEKSGADFIYMCKYFSFESDAEGNLPQNFQINSTVNANFPNEPVFETPNLAERMAIFFRLERQVMPWLRFIKRDFLIKNKIYFPEVLFNEDNFWAVKLLLMAEKILCVSSALYVYRKNPISVTRKKRSAEDSIAIYMSPVISGAKYMSDMKREIKFFRDNPQFWYDYESFIIKFSFGRIFEACAHLQPSEICDIIRQKFSKELGEHAELISCLCTLINTQQKMLAAMNGKISR